jgi:hypothetical protein
MGLRLGGAIDPTSPMYETLTPGTITRTVTVADLNIHDPPDGADPQSAWARRPVGPAVVISAPPSANERIMVLDAALAEWFSGEMWRMPKNKLISRMSV